MLLLAEFYNDVKYKKNKNTFSRTSADRCRTLLLRTCRQGFFLDAYPKFTKMVLSPDEDCIGRSIDALLGVAVGRVNN